MAKNPIGFTEASSVNYIKQIFDGSVTHDIAVEKGITFYNGGKDAATAFTWDGTRPLEVVIPTLADIVANPVVLKGVINDPATDTPKNPQPGYLVYIGKNITFDGQACEAGDMAVYYNDKWNVISGENQIQLAGTTDASGNHSVVLSETAAKVIEVEGKDLSLSVNYADILGKITADGNAEKTISLKDGKTVISGKYLTLSSSTAKSKDITTSVSIDLPTALASGAVTISDKVLVKDNFTFTSGSFPTIKKNAAPITVNATHNMTIKASGTTGDFVTGVTAIKGVSLSDVSDKVNSDIAYVAALSAVSGKSFVSGIHAHTAADGSKDPDFTVPGVVTAASDVNTFVTGVEDSTSGLVSSITVGAVTGNFVTGLSKNGTSVLTSVTFGDAGLDTSGQRDWFVTGLADNAKAVTDVNFGSVVVTPQTSSAIVSASVNNHVLSFNTGNFMTSATAALRGTGVTTKAFTKGGVKLSGFSSTSDTLKTGSVSQAETTISYKSLKTGAVTLTQGTTGFHFDKEASAAYTPVMGYKKVNVTAADVSKANAVLDNTAITANIPAEQVVVGLNAGTLPSLTIAAPTGELAGTVGTELTTVSKGWLAVDPDKKMIAGATTWSLVETAVSTEGIEVAKAGTYDVSGNTVIEKDSFIAAVKVSGTLVPTTPKA